MNILILSDTHFRRSFSLGSDFMKKLSEADRIIHCGDFTGSEFYNFLNSTGKLTAVRGNNDHELKDLLPAEVQIELEGRKITVLHGHLCSLSTIHLRYQNSDIVIHGHTHHPQIENIGGQLILNPGSFSMNRYVDQNTFMTLYLGPSEEPRAEIHYLNNRRT
ncbi:MAG: metallophosphoesterase [Candidatus Delongbacteria bacterium]|jgi:putative phosphoesterase|nr:metallophosphoesterase [Candidatus Delongbacteria bacterium]MDD4204731.1 metallophosphoesterase [Candidatus Delongbacteria bacterium]MDY0016834.1 metallophosphoesterase [Candidatus Delongbacteria bacterium]